MIKFFRQSYAVQYVVIALLAIALWVPSFMAGKAPLDLTSPVTPIFNGVDGLLSFSPIAKIIFAFLLLVFETLLFNAVLVNNQIVGKVSTMGAFTFVLLMSLTRTQADFYPFALSVIFIILAISALYEVYLSQSSELELLKAGICIALASMCYFPAILLIVWVIVALPIAKKGSLRLELIPLVAFLFVYFFYFVGVYLFGDFLTMIHGYRDYFLQLKLSVDGFNIKNIILLSFLLIAAIGMLFGNSNLEKTIAVRVKMTISVLLLVVGVLMLFLGGNVLMNGLILMALAIIFSYEFTYMDNTGWANLALVFFLLLVFANQYYFKWL
jgi:hypothetical protein